MHDREPRRRLVRQSHRRRPLRAIMLPLVVLLAIILLLPRLIDLLE